MEKPTPVNKVYVPLAGPPPGPPPSRDIYPAMGKEHIYQMLADFYAELEQSSIRSMFADDMQEASKRSAAFFVGLLGGPPLYQRLYGNPQLRARHLPFPIDEAARQTWLDCFKTVLKDAPERYHFPSEHMPGFIAFLDRFSEWMINKAPKETSDD